MHTYTRLRVARCLIAMFIKSTWIDSWHDGQETSVNCCCAMDYIDLQVHSEITVLVTDMAKSLADNLAEHLMLLCLCLVVIQAVGCAGTMPIKQCTRSVYQRERRHSVVAPQWLSLSDQGSTALSNASCAAGSPVLLSTSLNLSSPMRRQKIRKPAQTKSA